MAKLLFSSLLFAFVCSLVKAECPAINDIPIMYDDNAFTCTEYWTGHGDELAIHACNDCPDVFGATLRDGADYEASEDHHYPMGSIIVKAGCSFYMFYDRGYSGDYVIYDGPVLITDNNWGHESVSSGCDRGPASMQCRCQQKPVTCVPTDGYQVVLFCDNSGNSEPTTCTYSKSIGTSYSDSMSQSMSIDETISAELQMQFFRLFSETIGVSATTGYDWNHASEETKSEEVTVTVEAEAAPGMVLVIEQAVGTCDGSTAKTEMFRITQNDPMGNVVSIDYKMAEKRNNPLPPKPKTVVDLYSSQDLHPQSIPSI